MKKVYIPTEEELHKLENIGVNTYYYLLSKTIESIIMADVIYEEEDMFDVAYEEFSDYPQIIYSIAKMYPERIAESVRASNDMQLCKKIILTLVQNDRSIYGLDQMKYFQEEVLRDKEVISLIIDTLSCKLHTSPRYRFEYNSPNEVLDKIFACEVDTESMDEDTLGALSFIDPIYLAKTCDLIEDKEMAKKAKKSIIRYANIYGLNAHLIEYLKPNILVENNEKIKRMIRCLDRHRNYYNL